MKRLNYPMQLLRAACRPEIVRFAIKVSVVVGTVLNLINQSDALLGHGAFSWVHGFLNYAVPFCVSAFSGGRNHLINLRKS